MTVRRWIFALTLLAVVGAVALGLAALGVAAVALRRRGRVPDPLRSLAAMLLATVVVVTGFGVLAMLAEAPLAAVLSLLLVALSLTMATARARRQGPARSTSPSRRRWPGVAPTSSPSRSRCSRAGDRSRWRRPSRVRPPPVGRLRSSEPSTAWWPAPPTDPPRPAPSSEPPAVTTRLYHQILSRSASDGRT